jgi:hypothetical protein
MELVLAKKLKSEPQNIKCRIPNIEGKPDLVIRYSLFDIHDLNFWSPLEMYFFVEDEGLKNLLLVPRASILVPALNPASTRGSL